jgi:hypothetical protein
MNHEKNNISIKCVYGSAGTGKTYKLCKSIIKRIINGPNQMNNTHEEIQNPTKNATQNNDFMVCAYTHSAVMNVLNTLKSICENENISINIDESNFATLHSYFRIMFGANIKNKNTATIKGPKIIKSYIYIDEFSLIYKRMFKMCMNTLKDFNKPIKVIIYGDPLQLPPIIYKYQNYVQKTKIGVSKLYRLLQTLEKLPSKRNFAHMTNTLFFSSALDGAKKVRLSGNKRANDKILKMIDDIYNFNPKTQHQSPTTNPNTQDSQKSTQNENSKIVQNTNSRIRNLVSSENWISYDSIPQYIQDDYVFLASKHETIQQIIMFNYERNIKNQLEIMNVDVNANSFEQDTNTRNNNINTPIPVWSTNESLDSNTDKRAFVLKQFGVPYKTAYKCMILVPHMKIITSETSVSFTNGEELEFLTILQFKRPGNKLMMKCKNYKGHIINIPRVKHSSGNYFFPVYPAWVSTIHRAQGRSIDNVIICIDDMFDMCMLYTAITRARHNIVFYTKNPRERQTTLINNAYINDFNEMKHIVYSSTTKNENSEEISPKIFSSSPSSSLDASEDSSDES